MRVYLPAGADDAAIENLDEYLSAPGWWSIEGLLPDLCGQGFLARCLLAWPSSRIGSRHYAETDLAADPALEAYRRTMTGLLDRQLPVRPETPQELEPRALQLVAEAKRRWIALHDHIEDSMREGGELASVRAWGSKAPAQILRVAAVLTLVADSGASVIQTETIDQAADIVLYALEEAVRLIGHSQVPVETQHAQALLEWCHASTITLLHSGAALQFGPNPIRTKAVFDAAIRELERAGWAIPIPDGAEIDGKRRRRVWRIHP